MPHFTLSLVCFNVSIPLNISTIEKVKLDLLTINPKITHITNWKYSPPPEASRNRSRITLISNFLRLYFCLLFEFVLVVCCSKLCSIHVFCSSLFMFFVQVRHDFCSTLTWSWSDYVVLVVPCLIFFSCAIFLLCLAMACFVAICLSYYVCSVSITRDQRHITWSDYVILAVDSYWFIVIFYLEPWKFCSLYFVLYLFFLDLLLFFLMFSFLFGILWYELLLWFFLYCRWHLVIIQRE